MPTTLGEAHQPLRDQVRDVLRHRILTGEMPPGTRLVERSLAEELGVSRIPVRDALNMLKGEGFVTELPRRGVIVTAMSIEDAEELFAVRAALEVLSVELATLHGTAEELERLRDITVHAQTAHDEGDQTVMVGCNQDFHAHITSMAHNALLADVLSPLEGRLHWLLRQNDNQQELLDEHAELVEAIASRDVGRATAMSRQHVATSRRIALDRLHQERAADEPLHR